SLLESTYIRSTFPAEHTESPEVVKSPFAPSSRTPKHSPCSPMNTPIYVLSLVMWQSLRYAKRALHSGVRVIT
ncbi:MAG: hypothetical protein AB8G99_26775, partial [Planctomycetaceae bacterium]